MRARSSMLALGALLLVATTASNASADVPAFSDLPSGHATAPPETRPPASIPATEKVPGFFLATPKRYSRLKGMKAMKKAAPPAGYVLVVGSAEQAKRVADGDTTRGKAESDVCFTQHRSRPDVPSRKHGSAPPEEDDEPMNDVPQLPDWDEGYGSISHLQLKSEDSPGSGVTAVHSERLVRDASGVHVDMVDVWVDPATTGVRKIGSATLPLKLVGTTRGLEIYAAREQRESAKGKTEAVHFVIVPPKDVPNHEDESLFASNQEGRGATSSGCSHLRVALVAGDGISQSSVLRATLRLPDEPEREQAGEDEQKRARVREASVQFGVSQTKRDKQPMLSLTFGWAGRETTQPIRPTEN